LPANVAAQARTLAKKRRVSTNRMLVEGFRQLMPKIDDWGNLPALVRGQVAKSEAL
jgi:hypothetical protein